MNATPTAVPYSVPITGGQPATFQVPSTPATVGTWTAGNSGTITYTPGPVDFTFNDVGFIVTATCVVPPPIPALGTTKINPGS